MAVSARLGCLFACFLFGAFCSFGPQPATADLLVTSVFFNSVDRYDDQTGQLIQQGFFTPTVNPGEPHFLTDIVVNPANHHAYVSANFTDSGGVTRIFHFDAVTGAPLPNPGGGTAGVFLELDGSTFNPAGLALDADGHLYIANQGGLNIDQYDTAAQFVRSYGDGGASVALPSGLAFGPGGDLYATNFGNGNIVTVDVATGAITLLAARGANGPFAPNGIVIGPDGEFYVADVFSNGIFKYAADGSEIPGLDGGPFITVELPNIPPDATHPNAPSGLAFGQDGNLLVAVLGPTNPMTGGENHGALMRFDADTGDLLQAIAYDLPPAAGLAWLPPSPSADFDGDGDIDGNDFIIWQTAFQIDPSGDADFDADTDAKDLLIWKNQFGSGSSYASAQVPEPAAWILLALAMALVGSIRR